MTIDDIPADVLMTLTNELDRLFRAVHCKPTCHGCGATLSVGDSFQLISYRGRDQMACSKCDREKIEQQQRKRMENAGLHWSKVTNDYEYPDRGKGYSRPSKEPHDA